MKIDNLKDLKQADETSRAVISLAKLIIGGTTKMCLSRIAQEILKDWGTLKVLHLTLK